jgi:hypothetical protein
MPARLNRFPATTVAWSVMDEELCVCGSSRSEVRANEL